jgi:hypothetical protein
MVQRIFASKEKVTGSWRRRHNEEFHNLYLLGLNIVDGMVRTCSTYGRNA